LRKYPSGKIRKIHKWKDSLMDINRMEIW
jgi:hypothetical protein